MGQFQPVAAPLLAPPTVGLIRAMQEIQESGTHWEGGFAYAPENACQNAQAIDPCAGTEINTQLNEDIIENVPVGLVASDECNARGWSERDFQARATRLLLAAQEKQLAREFLTGEIATGAGWPNRYLQDSNLVELTSGAASPTVLDGIACLEQALSHCGIGGQGVLHVTAQTLTYMAADHLIERVGNLLLTYNGNVVVVSPGYDGSGPSDPPANQNVWAFATGLVQIRLGQIFITPDTMAQATDSQNRVKFTAQRVGAATWDGCCQFGIELPIGLCSPMGS